MSEVPLQGVKNHDGCGFGVRSLRKGPESREEGEARKEEGGVTWATKRGPFRGRQSPPRRAWLS